MEEPAVWISQATVIDVSEPLGDADAAAWLTAAGEAELERGLEVLNWALFAYRTAAADPHQQGLERRQALTARVGVGAGEEVADGRWSDARELPWEAPRRPRRRMLAPEGRLAAMLTGRDRPLVCEELALRARLDFRLDRSRHAALQVLVALDTAIAELSDDQSAGTLVERIAELRGFREAVAGAAQTALREPPDSDQVAAVEQALGRIEAALRARAAGRG